MKLKNIIINKSWKFWDFWGTYLPDDLIPIMKEVNEAFLKLKDDKKFIKDLKLLHKNFIWRPSPLIFAENLTKKLGWAKIYLKNEWVNHTWAHKINHAVGQWLIAKYLWKKRIIAETWAWQHGLATASVCAKLGLDCVIYMWKKDYDRQRPNVIYMELSWAKVIPVTSGNQTLNDSIEAAVNDLRKNPNSYYLLWTACWPNPYPSMNVYFQKIIWEEVRKQLKEYSINYNSDIINKEEISPLQSKWQVLKSKHYYLNPDYMIACVGWWSNSLWFFYDFLDDKNVKLVWVEWWWKWIKSWLHAVRFAEKKVWHGDWYKSYFVQDEYWNIKTTYSIAAWLDYSWVSPQIAYLENIWRLEMTYATDDEVLKAIKTLMQTEWILSALESAHWLAYAMKLAPTLSKDKIIVCNLSGRWDKDLFITAPKFDDKFIDFLKEYIKIK